MASAVGDGSLARQNSSCWLRGGASAILRYIPRSEVTRTSRPVWRAVTSGATREDIMTLRDAALVGFIAIAGLTEVVGGQNAGSDWPQWRGPNRDGTLTAFAEPKAWPEHLTQRWKVEVGTGYATPIVVGSRVYAFCRQGENEVMRALDAASGKALW